jgi:hypothetical protein
MPHTPETTPLSFPIACLSQNTVSYRGNFRKRSSVYGRAYTEVRLREFRIRSRVNGGPYTEARIRFNVYGRGKMMAASKEKVVKTDIISVRCTNNIYRLLAEIARIKSMTVSQYLLYCVKDMLMEKEREILKQAKINLEEKEDRKWLS